MITRNTYEIDITNLIETSEPEIFELPYDVQQSDEFYCYTHFGKTIDEQTGTIVEDVVRIDLLPFDCDKNLVKVAEMVSCH